MLSKIMMTSVPYGSEELYGEEWILNMACYTVELNKCEEMMLIKSVDAS